MTKLLKTALPKTLKKALLLTCLIISGCKSDPATFPKDPQFTLKQPIIEQQFCNDHGGDCYVKSVCREYERNADEVWIFKQDHELKFCHGIFGVNSKEVATIKAYIRDVRLWVKKATSSVLETE